MANKQIHPKQKRQKSQDKKSGALSEKRLFASLDKKNQGFIYKSQILTLLKSAGIGKEHQCLKHLYENLAHVDELEKIHFKQFKILTKEVFAFLESVELGGLIIPNFKHFTDNLTIIFSKIAE